MASDTTNVEFHEQGNNEGINEVSLEETSTLHNLAVKFLAALFENAFIKWRTGNEGPPLPSWPSKGLLIACVAWLASRAFHSSSVANLQGLQSFPRFAPTLQSGALLCRHRFSLAEPNKQPAPRLTLFRFATCSQRRSLAHTHTHTQIYTYRSCHISREPRL